MFSLQVEIVAIGKSTIIGSSLDAYKGGGCRKISVKFNRINHEHYSDDQAGQMPS